MLELKNASLGYAKQPVLEDVSTCFEKGRLIGVVGVNGSGKSTLLRAMAGLLPPHKGEILLDGKPLRELRGKTLARNVAYLAQGKATPDMTVEQMVLHGRFPYLSYPHRYTSRDRAAAREAMDAVGILPLAQKPLYTLSGGMRQTAYLAMALAQESDYILLDEPTTYLDIAHQLALMQLLRTLADRGKGVVAVLHDLPLAFDFSDELLLINGKKAAIKDTPQALCESPLLQEVFGVRLVRAQDSGRYYCAF